MQRAKFIKTVISSFLVICVLWVATPKVYVHQLLNHKHEVVKPTGETSVQEKANAEDCDFDKYDTPVYFSIFKLINNFIPLKSKEEAVLVKPSKDYNSFTGKNVPARAPPIA